MVWVQIYSPQNTDVHQVLYSIIHSSWGYRLYPSLTQPSRFGSQVASHNLHTIFEEVHQRHQDATVQREGRTHKTSNNMGLSENVGYIPNEIAI